MSGPYNLLRAGCVAAGLVLAVCSTRVPPEPSDTEEAQPAESVSELLNIFKNAVHDTNFAQLELCFDDSFRFVANEIDSLTYPSQLASWDRDKELDFYRHLVDYIKEHPDTVDDFPFVNLTQREGYVFSEDDTLLNLIFDLEIPGATSTFGLPVHVGSQTDLYVRHYENSVYIYRWEEVYPRTVNPLPMFGELKGELCKLRPCGQ